MTKKILKAIALISLACILQAHEFWLQPEKFRANIGEQLAIRFSVGERLVGEPWKFTRQKLDRIEHHTLGGVKDLKANVVESERENLKIQLTEAGTHLVALQSGNSFIKTDAETFNAYLKEEGLEDAFDFREKKNLLADSATESYSRHSKLLLQVGGQLNETYRKEIGFPVEIVPLENPYGRKIGERLTFKVLYQGKPLFGTRVKIMNRHQNRTTIQNIYSQQDGTIETTLSNPGQWMVSFVKMVPSKDPKAQWKSYWASLTFGI